MEEEREQSDAGTLPTIEIPSSATSADEDDIEVLRITGLILRLILRREKR